MGSLLNSLIKATFQHRFNQLMDKNETVDSLAIKMGLQPRTVYGCKHGFYIPNDTVLEIIAKYFGVTKQWLLGKE